MKKKSRLISVISIFVFAGVTCVQMDASADDNASFTDCTDCPEMVWLPPGEFMMGASAEEEERQKMPASARGNLGPVHKVKFEKRFAMGKYPITRGQFGAFVEETNYQTSDSCTTQHWQDGHMVYERALGYTWRSPGYPQTEDHPVVCVNWYDAIAYTEWLSKKTGHNYTLPNEAQFEYSARAGTTTSFFWGDDRDETACLYANLPDFDQGRAMGDVPMGPDYRFPCSDGYAYTSPVGSYRPNNFGLYDMFGNIWHWTADCWNPNQEGAPADGSTRVDGDCDAHPSKGGSYGNAVYSAFAGIRGPRDADYVGHSWGFRVLRTD